MNISQIEKKIETVLYPELEKLGFEKDFYGEVERTYEWNFKRVGDHVREYQNITLRDEMGEGIVVTLRAEALPIRRDWFNLAQVVPGSTVEDEVLGYQYHSEEELEALLSKLLEGILNEGMKRLNFVTGWSK